MRLSVWLLKYLPRFTHICPKCRKEVKANSHECPYCGEKYPLTFKIPPTFLKDKKKLEAYVHEHVFPRISEFERNYLTQYFTVFFSDGFESGNFSAWTTIIGSPSIVTSPVHSGIYAMGVPNTDNNSFVEEQLGSSVNDLHVRFYFYPSSLSSSWTRLLEICDLNYTTIESVVVIPSASSNNWYTGTSYGTASIIVNQWVCVEAEIIAGSGNGVCNLWVNGVQIINSTGQTITAPQLIFLGNTYSDIDWTFYIDDVVVADTYIGPISTTTNINVSDSGSGSDAIASLQAYVPISDAGLGSDALSSLKAQIPVSDAGAGADSVGVQGAIPVSDVGSGIDSIASLQAQVPIADSSSGLDNATVQGQIPVSDSGLGSDAVSLKNQIPVADLGLGTDSITVGNPITLSDSGSGSDAVQIQAQILINDVGTGLDLAIVKVNTIISDVGLGSDVLTVSVPISISDVGLGVDSVVVVVLSSLPTHAIIIQSETGKITLQSEKGNVALQSEKGAVTLQSDSD